MSETWENMYDTYSERDIEIKEGNFMLPLFEGTTEELQQFKRNVTVGNMNRKANREHYQDLVDKLVIVNQVDIVALTVAGQYYGKG